MISSISRMQRPVLFVLLLLLSSSSCCTAMRQPLSAPADNKQQPSPPPANTNGAAANPLFQQLQQQLSPQVSSGQNNSGSQNTNGQQVSGGQNNSGSQNNNGVSANPLFQQLQQQLSPQVSGGQNNSSSQQQGGATALKPTEQFVTLEQQQRPAALEQAQEQRKQQQAQEAHPSLDKFKCGAPFMPCGSAIPADKTCKKGPGWCEPGHYCGYEATTSEPSRCLPLPKDCGKAGSPCCPSNKDSPHTSTEDKLSREPFCTDGSVCFYFAPVPGFNNGDTYAANKGAYACTAVEDDCGTGPGKPCCPFAHKVTTNPPLKRTGCADDMFCNYDFSATAAAEALSSEYRTASVPGTCERNAADCGQFDKGCCITTSPLSTSMTCGARWNETGQRGYCADPFDSNNSAGPGLTGGPPQVAVAGRRFLLDSGGSDVSSKGGSASDGGRNGGDNGSSSGGGNGDGSGKGGDGSDSNSTKQRARLNQLVCTRCPPRNDNVANNPSKYWPC